MSNVRSPVSLFLLFLVLSVLGVQAAPKRKGNGNGGGGGGDGATQAQTPQQQAAQIAQGVSQATDGSTILDTTARVKCVYLRGQVARESTREAVLLTAGI